MRLSIIHRLLGLAILALAPVSAAHAQQAPVRGDVNGDGRVTPADAQAVRDHVAGRPAQPGITLLPNGDANGDGRITGVDAAIIQAFAAGRAPGRFGVGKPVTGDGKGGSLMMLYECTVDVEAGTQSCGTPRPAGAAADVILGKSQIGFVTTGAATSRANTADEDTTSANVAITNNLEQPIGTTDGTSAAASGTRVFFYDGPRVISVRSGTLASASVRLEGTDGTADFSSPDGSVVHNGKAYIQYDGVLAKGATSSPKPWRFVYTPNTKSFYYAFLVSAPVQYEYGWAVISPSALVLRTAEASSPLTASVYDHTGAQVSDGVTWSSSDPAVATVDASTGVVTGVAIGTATITATSSVKSQRAGSITVSVGALWTGAASGEWSSAANWFAGVVPDSTRDATIPASSPNTPTFTAADGSVLTLVANGPVNLGGFTLQIHGSLEGTGTISSGKLWLRGTELQGNTPALLITSGVTVDGPTKATGAVSIQNGSLEISGSPMSISIP
jgi:hypothetical protein